MMYDFLYGSYSLSAVFFPNLVADLIAVLPRSSSPVSTAPTE